MRIPEIDVIDDDINKKEEVFDEESRAERTRRSNRHREYLRSSPSPPYPKAKDIEATIKSLKEYEKGLEGIEKDEDKLEEIVA